MRFLLDENLSPRLVSRLISLFGTLTHVRDVGLQRSGDRVVWDWAKTNAYSVITTDGDFLAMSRRLGWPPKIIHIEQCDHPLAVIEDLLRRNAIRISEFVKDSGVGVLSLRVPIE